ncbi:MAG: dihydroorotate dehydrogenase electron transfer subunit [Methanosarcinales archaeon]|nr:dihydroorotate dehydrogenase electron transfer subunit [Methanosarcinales archaeon]
MRPVNAIITEIIRETPTIITLRTDIEPDAAPGQFVMVWVRGLDEIPMALSHPGSITVQRVGEATEALSHLDVGDSIGIRGPFGNGFEVKGEGGGDGNGEEDGGGKGNKIMIIAGGVGGAPLLPLAQQAQSLGLDVTTLIGARTADELLFEKHFSKCGALSIATDDGSKGHHGFITGAMDMFNLAGFDQFYICGPELMMKSVLDILQAAGLEAMAQLSLHRYFKCGIGVCGACTIDPSGLRVCRDGPVLSGDLLIKSELGNYHRDATGKKITF